MSFTEWADALEGATPRGPGAPARVVMPKPEDFAHLAGRMGPTKSIRA